MAKYTTRELLTACQDSVKRRLDAVAKATPGLKPLDGSFVGTMINLHRPMLEYLRDELAEIAEAWEIYAPHAPPDGYDADVHRLAEILAHDDPAIKQMLGGSDETA